MQVDSSIKAKVALLRQSLINRLKNNEHLFARVAHALLCADTVKLTAPAFLALVNNPDEECCLPETYGEDSAIASNFAEYDLAATTAHDKLRSIVCKVSANATADIEKTCEAIAAEYQTEIDRLAKQLRDTQNQKDRIQASLDATDKEIKRLEEANKRLAKNLKHEVDAKSATLRNPAQQDLAETSKRAKVILPPRPANPPPTILRPVPPPPAPKIKLPTKAVLPPKAVPPPEDVALFQAWIPDHETPLY